MILYFSGTGNSRLVALRLAKILGDRFLQLEYPFPNEVKLDDEKRLIWVFPVYCWSVPPVVKKFISQIYISHRVEHFMVCTCGDDVGLTAEVWRKTIKNRSWTPIGCWSVQMPNTYVLLPGFNTDSENLEKVKLEKSILRINDISRGIRHRARVDDVVRGSFAWIKTRILNPLFVKFMTSPKPFRASDKCIGCEICNRKCPMKNIVMINRRPSWGARCAMCLECYHCCPVHAVEYGKRTKSKGQYQAPNQL